MYGTSSVRRTNTRSKTLSRTRTATATRTRTGTRATTATTDVYIASVIGNNERDVGFCAYNLNGFQVELRQFADLNTYGMLTTALCVVDPVEIIMCVSDAGGRLARAINGCQYLDNFKRTFVGRPYFNETYGAIAAEKLSNTPCQNLKNLGTSGCYLALSACGALIRYIEHVEERSFAPASLEIRFRPNDTAVFIDWWSLQGLEVVSNARASLGIGKPADNACLLRVMDKTKTRAGKRFLRRALLEPSASLEAIIMRQDAVEDLLNSEKKYFAVVSALAKFPDLENALASLLSKENARLRHLGQLSEQHAQNSQNNTDLESNCTDDNPIEDSSARRMFNLSQPPSMRPIRDVLNLKAALTAVPIVLEAIEDCQSPFMNTIACTMRSEQIVLIQKKIDEVIDEEAVPARDTARMRMQGAFAVKFGRNGTLDVYRKVVSENVDDMKSLEEEMKTKYHLPKLKLAIQGKRGYHFTIPSVDFCMGDLPEEFICVFEGKRLHRFSSVELERLNSRYHDALQEIWRLQEVELGSLLAAIFKPEVLHALHQLCDSIALLDTITSFATYSTLCPVKTERPKMSETGPIALREAYHPILLHVRGEDTVPNDIFLYNTSKLHIVTGANQSGKSTYIRMVGLIAIMAHTGCMVPANFAHMRLLHKLMTRFRRANDVARHQSDFSQEMSDMATIFECIPDAGKNDRVITPPHTLSADVPASSVLVLVDELGRSTSTVDGFSTAYAMAECLANSENTLTLFTTHFIGLGALAKLNPFVKCFHLETKDVKDGAGEGTSCNEHGERRKFTYNVVLGTVQDKNYGFHTAMAAGFDKETLDRATRLLEHMPSRTISTPETFLEHHVVASESEKRQFRALCGIVSLQERIALINHTCEVAERRERLLLQLQTATRQAMLRQSSSRVQSSRTRPGSIDHEAKRTRESR